MRRRNAPGAGLWSLPGGRVESGETDAAAVIREVREETGLTVACGALLGTVTRSWWDTRQLEIRDYTAMVTGGEVVPGDDATAARWVSPGEFAEMDSLGRLTAGLSEALRSWGVLR